jgi:hypothetical protein
MNRVYLAAQIRLNRQFPDSQEHAVESIPDLTRDSNPGFEPLG